MHPRCIYCAFMCLLMYVCYVILMTYVAGVVLICWLVQIIERFAQTCPIFLETWIQHICQNIHSIQAERLMQHVLHNWWIIVCFDRDCITHTAQSHDTVMPCNRNASAASAAELQNSRDIIYIHDFPENLDFLISGFWDMLKMLPGIFQHFNFQFQRFGKFDFFANMFDISAIPPLPVWCSRPSGNPLGGF